MKSHRNSSLRYLAASFSIAGFALTACAGGIGGGWFDSVSSETDDSAAESTSVAPSANSGSEWDSGRESESNSKSNSIRDKTDGETDEIQVMPVNTDGLHQLDVEMFGKESTQSFTFVNDGRKAECFVAVELVTCIGTPRDSVPDVEIPPFPKQRPGAIQLGYAGAAYTMVEGAEPAERELKDGQWVDFGHVYCAKPDGSWLTCKSDAAAFSIKGADLDIRTEGKVFDSVEELLAEGPGPAGSYSQREDTIVQAPMLCGAMDGPRLAQLEKGEMSCKEAMSILDRYDAVKMTEGQGNTLIVEIGNWVCSSPSSARSKELQAKTVCEDPVRGAEVRDPVM